MIHTNPHNDRMLLLSTLLKDCETLNDFQNRFTQIQDFYFSLPKCNNVYPKLILVTPWSVFLKEYCRENTSCDKSIKDLSKEASSKWKCNASKKNYYVKKAFQENENNLEIWKRFYANIQTNVHENMNNLKSEKYIKTLKKQELIHLIGCIGKSNVYTQNDINVKNMRKDLCTYFRHHTNSIKK